MLNLLALATLASLCLPSVLAQATLGECGPGKLCPKDKPCCSRKYSPTLPFALFPFRLCLEKKF